MRHEQAIRFIQTLTSLARRGASGVLQVVGDDRKARLTFLRGKVVFVEHRSLGGTLGAWLVTRSMITREQYQEIAEHVREHPGASPMVSFVEYAVARGFLEMDDASAILAGQVERNFLELFTWDAFELRFTEDESMVERTPRFPCDLDALLLVGIRAGFDAEALRAHFAPRDAFCPSPLVQVSDLIARFRFDADELKVVRLLNGERTVRELFASRSLEPAAVGRVLLALRMSGHMEWQTGPKEDAEKPDSTPSQPVPIAVIRLTPREDPSVRLTLPAMEEENDGAATAYRRAVKEWRAGRLVAAHDAIGAACSLGKNPEHALFAAWIEHEIGGFPHDADSIAKLEEAADRCHARDATCALAHFVSGHVQLVRGDLRGAEIAFYRAHKLDPNDTRSRDEVNRLRRARHEKLDE